MINRFRLSWCKVTLHESTLSGSDNVGDDHDDDKEKDDLDENVEEDAIDEIDEFDDDASSATNFEWREYRWSKYRRPGFPPGAELAKAEELLGYAGFASRVRRFLIDKYGEWVLDSGVYVDVHNSVRMLYPSWMLSDVITETAGPAPEFLLPSKDTMTKATIVSTPRGRRRQETVLVSTPDRQAGVQKVHTMSSRQAAQIFLLFRVRCPYHLKVQDPESAAKWDCGLAYVAWFNVTQTANDTPNGLFEVVRPPRNQFGVVEVSSIERPVLLIPKFGTTIGETVEVKAKLDKANFRFHHSLEDKEAMEALDSMTHYNKFYVDSWQDSHLYRTIYPSK
jgi:hypothetical protein